MTLTRKQPRPEPRNGVILYVSWDEYLQFLEARGDRRYRITYDQGRLEIMTVSRKHEQSKSALGRVLEHLLVEMRVDFVLGGAPTFKRQSLDRGFEPDECYWIQSCDQAEGGTDLDAMPPPDLAIEVEVSRSMLNRVGIYQAFGVGEIWRFTRSEELIVLVRGDDGVYRTSTSSAALPGVPLEGLVQFARRMAGKKAMRVLLDLRAWVHAGFPPI